MEVAIASSTCNYHKDENKEQGKIHIFGPILRVLVCGFSVGGMRHAELLHFAIVRQSC